jgi:hypothetical protein
MEISPRIPESMHLLVIGCRLESTPRVGIHALSPYSNAAIIPPPSPTVFGKLALGILSSQKKRPKSLYCYCMG